MIVYKATNKENGKVYIGATTKTLEERRKGHISHAFGSTKNGYFQDAIVKYGPENFIFEPIDKANSLSEMYDKEQYWISYYNSTDNRYGYNLDSGGLFCKKSESTKRKIGDTTLRKWNDPEISTRMLNGLRKGTESWQKICQYKRVEFECPICGKVLYVQPYIAKTKRFCSIECAMKSGEYRSRAKYASDIAAEKSHERNLELKRDIAEDIIDWAFRNKSYVLRCKMNDVTNHFKPLTDFLYDKYGIFDLRSLYICFDVRNKKEFAQTLINIVSEENIC